MSSHHPDLAQDLPSMLKTHAGFDRGDRLANLAGDKGRVTLCVSGGRPLRLQAELLAECSSWAPNAPAWQELTLHRCVGEGDADGFAVAIRTCRGASGDSDVFHARVFAEIDTALAWVQGFDPTADLCSDLDAADRRVSASEIALRAATLRQRTDRVQLQYRAMVGELLYRLDLAA